MTGPNDGGDRLAAGHPAGPPTGQQAGSGAGPWAGAPPGPPAGGSPGFAWDHCPRCGGTVYQIDHYCGQCQLAVAPAPPGARPVERTPLPKLDPYKVCWYCRMISGAGRSFCTNCGADLRATAAITPVAKVRWYDRKLRNPLLSVSLTLLVFQTALLIPMWFLWKDNHSVANGIFLSGIAVSMAANIANGARLTMLGLRQRNRGRDRREPRP